MKLEDKLIIIGVVIFVFGTLLIALIGINAKENLNKEVGSIDNIGDVETFLEQCRKKPFLDCEGLLLKELDTKAKGDEGR